VNSYAPIAVIGIVIGISTVTAGVGFVNIGMAENAQAPPFSTERVCEEYGEYQDVNQSSLPDRGPISGNFSNTSTEEEATRLDREIGEPPCEEYTTYTTGGGSPGDSKIAGGLVLALLGGTIVYRSTR